MGFWNKLGKIALQAAPYVAAPFTGGASLAFAPATRQVGNMWAQHDANAAAKKGLGPSSFDRALGMASDVGGMVGGMGGFGGAKSSFGAGKFSPTGKLGAYSSGIGRVLGGYGGNQQDYGRGEEGGGNLGNSRRLPTGVLNYSGDTAVPRNDPGMDRFRKQARRGLGPVMGNMNQNNPNLAESIGAGRLEAIRNQPFRGGSEIKTLGDDDQVFTSRTPPIYPNRSKRRVSR